MDSLIPSPDIFSEFNNITDISLSPQYGTLLGFTREDILINFSEYLDEASKILSISPRNLISNLESQYGEFYFEETCSKKVHTPRSLLSFFSNPGQGLKNYWMDSPEHLSVLQNYFRSQNTREPQNHLNESFIPILELEAQKASLGNINSDILLLFSGLLTIKGSGSESFLVGCPNKEASEVLTWLQRDFQQNSAKLQA